MGLGLALACLVGNEAIAQEVPSPVEPGRIERQFEQPPKPKAVPKEAVPAIPKQLPPADAEKIRFELRRVVIDGSTVYTDKELRSFYQDYLNQEVSLAQVYAIAGRITAKYRNDGYVLSQVIVPPQRIDKGIVRLQVIEGFIDDVRIEGKFPDRRGLIKAYTEKILRSRPLRAKDLERYLLLVNDLPQVTARATLSPSATVVGASALTLEVSHDKAQLTADMDNRGSPFNGEVQGGMRGTLSSFFGRYEQIGLRFMVAERLRFLQLAYQEQLGTEGAKLDVSVFGSTAEPEGDPEIVLFRADSEAFTWTTTLSYPLIRSRIKNFSVRGTFDFHNDRREQEGFPDSFRDRIRSLRLGATYDGVDRWRGVTLADLQVSRGLDILGARETGSPNLSRLEGRSDYTKVNLYLARRQSLAERWSLLTAFSGQYASDSLLAYEEFGFGGTQFGRGYDSSELLGDHGAAVKAELGYTGTASRQFRVQYAPYAFYDFGTVWRRSTADGRESRESAASAGLGVRFDWRGHFEGVLEVAKPLTHIVASEGDNDPRVFFGLQINL